LLHRRTRLVYILIFLVATTAPYGFMYLYSVPDHTFTGFISLSEDDMTYLAKMRQGFEGSWLYRNPYTPEFTKQPGQPVFLFYLFLGHVGRWLSVPMVVVFHMARVLLGLVLAVLLVQVLTKVVGWQYFVAALVLATFGAGFEWTTYFGPDKLFFVPVPEAYVFSSALFYPHFIAALLSYLLLISIPVFDWPDPGSVGAGIGLLFGGLVLTSIHPYMWLAIAAVVAAVYLVERRSLRRLYWAIPWLAPVAAYGAYMLNLFMTSPVLGAWRAQTVTTFDLYWLLMLAPLLLAAFIGLSEAWKARGNGRVSLYGLLPRACSCCCHSASPAGLLRGGEYHWVSRRVLA